MRTLTGFRPDGTYDPLCDFTLDDGADPGLILLADRMCDVAESDVLPGLIRGADRIDMAFAIDLGDVPGWYVPGSYRRPCVLMHAPGLALHDDPLAAIAAVLAGALGRAWRESRHGRVDADEEARIVADAYRTLIDSAAPWRGTSMPSIT